MNYITKKTHKKHANILLCLVKIAVFTGLVAACQPFSKPGFARLLQDQYAYKYQARTHDLVLISNLAWHKGKGGGPSSLTIYLEGDGRPWSNKRYINRDPSPAYPLALHLMSQDAGAALYVARPCYQIGLEQLAKDTRCRPDLWTGARYSEEVVQAMEDAILYEISTLEPTLTLNLVGYSGGAALALILAQRIAQVKSVITVAGNLDTRAWTEYHGYSPLTASINPAEINLRKDISYYHLVGRLDRNVAPELGERVYSRVGHIYKEYKHFTHTCCWAENWQRILTDVMAERG